MAIQPDQRLTEERFSVVVDQAAFDDLVRILEGTGANARKWVKIALNDGTREGKSVAVAKVLEKANIGKTKVSKRISTHFASISKPTAKLRIKSGNIPLEEFLGTKVYKSKSKPGVYFKIWKDEPQEIYKHAFFQGRDKTRGVWERDTEAEDYDGRLPLRRKFGPSVATFFDKTRNVEAFTLKLATKKMLDRLNHYVDQAMKGNIL